MKKFLRDIKESIPAYLLIAPTIAVLCIFLYIPLFNAFRISLYKYKGYGEMTNFVGLSYGFLEYSENDRAGYFVFHDDCVFFGLCSFSGN